MKRVSFECEIITPMFMYGGDGQTLELRPSEFKGMLRFWWRALHPDLSLKDLKEKENEIFGSTNRKCGFRLVVEELKRMPDKNKNLNSYLGKKELKGIKYLFYSMFLGENKEKEYFLPKTTFKISFYFKNKNHIAEVLKSFWLLIYLGSLGSRSRRGAGNFKVININDKNEIIKKINLKFLIEDIKSFRETLKSILPANSNFNSYINLGNFSLYVYRTTFNTWKDALNSVGEDLQKFRNRKEPDYSSVKNFILKGKTGEVIRPAFGLPLEFRYRNLEKELGKKKNSAKLTGSNSERQRTGSPLFIKILKLSNRYVPIFIFFNKELLPEVDRIKISSRNKQGNKFLNTPNLSIICEFLDTLRNIGKIEEVQLYEN